ncbi:MAG: dihydropyrimidinase [Proteobacteria bacterium]|nr:dihydropyrimidinase [Pseudomonadota bacterium]
MADLDLVIRNGTVVTAADTGRCDVGVKDGRIVVLGEALARGESEIDAGGKLVLPGGIDSHVHLDQPSPETGARPANDFLSGTVSAACGGNTTVMPFVRQIKGASLREAVREYHRRAEGKAAIDYAFHLIVADPSETVLGQELPALIRDGYTSIKIYLTYDALRISDRQALDVLACARREGAIVMVHAENGDCIKWLTDRLLGKGLTAPKFKGAAHPPPAEREATHRAITLAEIAGVPVLIVHVASGEAAEQVRWARGRRLPVFAETCPQYLFLSEKDLDKPGMEGAKCVCAPAPGSPENQRALWAALAAGTFHLVSSDHAAFRFDDPRGKLAQGANAPFNRITNGIPGIEARLPLLFSGGVREGRISLNTFVALSATNAAKLYGLYPRKGTIAVGADADIAIWDPEREVTISVGLLHDGMDYTPYEGMRVRGWPVVTICRGEVVCRDFAFVGRAGRGNFLACEPPEVARRAGGAPARFDPAAGP